MTSTIEGTRWVVGYGQPGYPEAFLDIPDPPGEVYGIGNIDALQEGLAVIGARKATPYGRSCAKRFAQLAAEAGIPIVSGGARGCDSEAHRAALAVGGTTVAILGGGCDRVYPREHLGLFQQIVNSGGAVISEHHWDYEPRRYAFRARNRLIAGLARAVLIVEAGLPSGTFSTADEALSANRDVLVVPGSITSKSSMGSNKLLYQGATPVIDDSTFKDQLFSLFGCLKTQEGENVEAVGSVEVDPLIEAVMASPMKAEAVYDHAVELYGEEDARSEMVRRIAMAEVAGIIAKGADGLWGPA